MSDAAPDAGALFQQALGAFPVGMLLSDSSGRIRFANAWLADLLGYHEAELLDLTVDDLVPQPVAARHRAQRAAYHRSPSARPLGHERFLTARHRSGHEIPVEIGLNPVVIGGERLILAAIADLTEQQQERRRAHEREARLRALWDHANDGIAILGPDAVIREANRPMAAILGREVAELVGRPIADFLTDEARSPGMEEFRRLIAEGRGQARGVGLRRSDGSTAIVDFSQSTVRIGDEDVVFSIGREVTRERTLERQLLRAQRLEAIGQVTGGVAHDFNNLLTVISGNAELLAESADRPVEELAEITRATRRAADLTRQLLAFSRQQVLEPRVLDLAELVRGVEKMLRRVISEDVRLVTNLEPGWVLADPGQLEVVLMNLVVNARDAIEDGGTITIETAAVVLDGECLIDHAPVTAGEYVMLAVSDTGSGMSPETQARVFEPFFTTKEAGRGTGLGLATVYGVVKQSGGHVWVYSELGEGTTFKIHLPRVARSDAPAPRATERPATTGGNETVLIAEDDASVRRLTAGILERRGYRVVLAESAEHALELLADPALEVHLLLADVVMPGLSGPALARRAAEMRAGIKILYVSGYTDSTIARHGLTAGESFLQKPFSGRTLAEKVRAVLDS